MKALAATALLVTACTSRNPDSIVLWHAYNGAEKDALEAALATLKSAVEGSDLEAMKSAIEEVSTTSQAFAQKLYENTATENAGQYDADASGAGATGADDDDVVDAEVIDEEDGQS